MAQHNGKAVDFSLAYYSSDRKTGAISIVSRSAGETTVQPLTVLPESGLDKAAKPVLVGVTGQRDVVVLDPRTKALSLLPGLPGDGFPAHVYSDPSSNRDWFMNDGDKETGNDVLNCGDNGSSVTVVENTASADARFLATICVGRGHHQANFTFPSDTAPDVPATAYISNLKDGTLTAIGNDPANPDTYLKVIATINLCELDKEEGMTAPAVPNHAFPHGLVYSKVTGKLYNLNNGYGTIAVIDPRTNTIESRVSAKGFSNLFASPCGRYVFCRGADRKSDPDHVVAKLAVMDAATLEVLDSVDLADIYISKYFFNPEGGKLYLTTSTSGSPEQQANLKHDALLVFDLGALPRLQLTREVRLGTPAGTLDFVVKAGRTELVLSSNSDEGAVAVICGRTEEVLEKIPVTDGQPHSRLWLLPQ